jgi:hypothetical protein
VADYIDAIPLVLDRCEAPAVAAIHMPGSDVVCRACEEIYARLAAAPCFAIWAARQLTHEGQRPDERNWVPSVAELVRSVG